MIKDRLEKAHFDSVQAAELAAIFEEEARDKVTTEDLAKLTDKVISRMEAGFKEVELKFDQMDHKIETLSERVDHKMVTLSNETNHKIDTFYNETKNEFKMVRIEMGAIKSDLQKEISNSRFELLKWVIGALLINAGIILALLKFVN
jgi:hypothetical protein